MGWKRKSLEEGHKRKFLVIIDGTPECSRAVAYAAKRAEHTGGGLVMLYIIPPGDFQHWLGVENIMRAEQQEEAEEAIAKYNEMLATYAEVEPEALIRDGKPSEVIAQLIEEDEDIAILVLAAGVEGEGPGPLVSDFSKSMTEHFPIPLTIVPGDLSDEDINALA